MGTPAGKKYLSSLSCTIAAHHCVCSVTAAIWLDAEAAGGGAGGGRGGGGGGGGELSGPTAGAAKKGGERLCL